jgi:uncharacterized spore protein YtfJ
MDNSGTVTENLETLFGKLEKFLKTETVVGEPIVIGETTLVPIISVMFGCGEGGDKGVSGKGSGVGAAARISPNAILVIKKDEVTMLPVKGKTNLDSLINMVPEIVSKINFDKCKKDEKASEE